MNEKETMNNTPIRFVFDLYGNDTSQYAIEKDAGSGLKRRYLKGVASGVAVDGHGERMTDKAVRKMQEQANSGEILLYADKHGVAYTDDIGKLVKAEVDPTGDWQVEFRLYDSQDNIGGNTLERADKLWKQINGLPPYGKKHQRGFSIEGFIPEGGILQMSQDGRRIVDDVQLDGCVVVPRPAYKTSIVSAVYKALNEPAPWDLRKEMKSIIADSSNEEDLTIYFRRRYKLQDALETMIEGIMTNDELDNKKERLTEVFDEYKNMMVDLLTEHPEAYNPEELDSTIEVEEKIGATQKNSKIDLLKSLHENLLSMEQKLVKELI